MSNSVASSYLFGDAAAARFFPRSFRDPSDRRQAVSEAAKRRCSPQLLAVLRRQNERFGANALRHQRIEALERGSCAVVFTGQQVGLFGGPLYSFHKALSAIAVARQLEAESGTAVIPIFWLQTEDHDFAEIACCYAPGPDRSVTRFAVDESDPAGSERRSVASRVLGAGVDAALAALDACCEGLADWSATGEILRRHYCPEARWADAFAGLFAELFADDGLLLFDPRVPDVAALASDVHRRAIDERAAIEATLAARAEQLAAAGFDVQIPIRPGCALSFFHPDGPTGPRFRLTAAPDGWALAGDPRRFTTAAIDSALRERPLSFSTSALLRPLLQDQLFPTAAIVGGPGELAYFAELAPLYELFELPMPLCTPRGRFAIVEPRLASQLDEWALCAEDLARPDEELARHFRVDGGEGFAPETIRQRLFEPFANELQRLGSEIAPFDGGVQKTIDKTALHVGDVVDKLARRVEQAWYQADERRLTRLARGRHWLFPGGIPQERVYSWPYFAARFGPRELKRALSESYAPYSALVHEVRP